MTNTNTHCSYTYLHTPLYQNIMLASHHTQFAVFMDSSHTFLGHFSCFLIISEYKYWHVSSLAYLLVCIHIPDIRACSCSSSSVDDETGECFGQRRRVAGRGADEWNTQSQLETKERPAKGPIAQSWLIPWCTSHTYTYTHIVIIISLSSAFSLLSFTIPLSFSFPLRHSLLCDFHFSCSLCIMLFCVLAYFLCHSTLCDCTLSMGRI